ncbi:MAG: hypothetical protein CMP43_03975 [Rickettsiales bacterium]|nr:hypothetical protein [Rickettsiales bacterium]
MQMTNLIKIIVFIAFIFVSAKDSYSADFSKRKNLNKILNGFFKNQIFKCQYINKSWSIGFDNIPYGMVINSMAFKDILVFEHKNIIGTLWPNIGEISTEKGVKKYQLWKKKSKDEYVMVKSDFKSDSVSTDIDKDKINVYQKTYFDQTSLKVGVKEWITDFYSCEEINSSNFARKKLIDIFVNQDEYVKKDFAYREKNPSSFTSNIELLSK